MLRSLSNRTVLVIGCLTVAPGCGLGGPGRGAAPSVSPAAAAAAAVAACDANGDGRLEEAELAHSPSLRSVAARWDADGDKALSQAEITARFSQLFSTGVGLLDVSCTITRNGRPVPDCEVRFVPEDFLGAAFKPATGTTGPNGAAMMAVAVADRPADQQDLKMMQVGLYRVEVAGPGISQPAKPLGVVIDPTDSSGTNPTLDLASDGR